jgi:hypothetical protein
MEVRRVPRNARLVYDAEGNADEVLGKSGPS